MIRFAGLVIKKKWKLNFTDHLPFYFFWFKLLNILTLNSIGQKVGLSWLPEPTKLTADFIF
jgi:hypothetical protein